MPSYPQTSFSPPAGSTSITLVRHGQSAPADPEQPFALRDGHGDPELTDLGHRQAAAVGERLRHEGIDLVYVSTLVRTHQTAAPLVAHSGLDPIEEPDLREVFLGDWEGGLMRQKLAELTHPAAIEFRETLDWGVVPGAESNADLIARTSAAVAQIHQDHRGKHVACFVHGGVIAGLCAHASGASLPGFFGSDHTAIHRIVITDDRWVLRGFNDATHLTPDLRTPQAVIDQPA